MFRGYFIAMRRFSLVRYLLQYAAKYGYYVYQSVITAVPLEMGGDMQLFRGRVSFSSHLIFQQEIMVSAHYDHDAMSLKLLMK